MYAQFSTIKRNCFVAIHLQHFVYSLSRNSYTRGLLLNLPSDANSAPPIQLDNLNISINQSKYSLDDT